MKIFVGVFLCGIFVTGVFATPTVDLFKNGVDWSQRFTQANGQITGVYNQPFVGTPSDYGTVTKPAGTLSGTVDLSTLANGFPLTGTAIMTGSELTGDRVKWVITAPSALGQTVQVPINPTTTIAVQIVGVSGTMTAHLTQVTPFLDPVTFKPRTVRFEKSAADTNIFVVNGRVNGSIFLPITLTVNDMIYDGQGGGAGLGVVHGTATLQEWSATYLGMPITVTVGTNTQSTTLDATGNFGVVLPSAGISDVFTKLPLGLTKKTSAVDLGSAAAITPLHTNGDCNNDNVVDLSDYTVLVTAFNALPTSGNWDARADLNGDLVVDLTDYTRLVLNFNAIGD
ncbi:MAG: hypothetical protein K8R88_05885 [Armatimonadetes bacterium]|nr:hypothetical protein [Armatimonadota bacterium]